MQYNVVHDAAVIDEQFGEFSPFNLKKDIKDIDENELIRIAQNIADELKIGPGRPAYANVYICVQDNNVNYSKIRCEDKKRKKGKSDGYRCIVLVDNTLHYGFLLHVYRHGHGEDKDISKGDKNKLKQLVDEYVKQKQSYRI